MFKAYLWVTYPAISAFERRNEKKMLHTVFVQLGLNNLTAIKTILLFAEESAVYKRIPLYLPG